MHDQRRPVAPDPAGVRRDVPAPTAARRGLPDATSVAGAGDRQARGARAVVGPAGAADRGRPRRWQLTQRWQLDGVAAALRQLPLDGDRGWVVTVEPAERRRRTDAQNRRYWAVVAELAEASGHDRDAMHCWLKGKFLGARWVEFAGEVVEVQADSRTLSVAAFGDYVDRVVEWAWQELGVSVDE